MPDGSVHLEEALTLAREVNQPRMVLLATVYRARLPGGDIDAALAALEEHEESADYSTRMRARFRLWELTQDEAHLAEAKRLLDFAVEHSPEEYRTSMIENVPLHRDIMRAWEEHREKAAQASVRAKSGVKWQPRNSARPSGKRSRGRGGPDCTCGLRGAWRDRGRAPLVMRASADKSIKSTVVN